MGAKGGRFTIKRYACELLNLCLHCKDHVLSLKARAQKHYEMGGCAEAILIVAYGKGLKKNPDSSWILEELMPQK